MKAFGKLTKTLFAFISLFCISAIFVTFDQNVHTHFRYQILGKSSPLYSIDTIFQYRYIQVFQHHLSFNNKTEPKGEWPPQGFALRQHIFKKEGRELFISKQTSPHLFNDTYLNNWNFSSLQSSPYVLPSHSYKEGEFFYDKSRLRQKSHLGKQTKLVAFYNKPSWINQQITFDKCEVSDCRIMGTLGYHKSHALVFYTPFLSQQNPPIRQQGQRWVYFNLESPTHTSNVTSSPSWRHQFNLTMTYRTDSDIFLPYAYFRERDNPSSKDYESVARRKTRLVAVFMSNCQGSSKRLEYVKELQKYISVDVYGKCGPFKCYSKHHKDCLNILDDRYKFYLSFENSLCVDYVTEKFTKTFRDIDVVPIVRGGAHYDKILPQDTYIDTAWFAGPKDLALFLKRIDKDEQLYVQLLRQHGRFVEVDPLPIQRAFCDLCHRLHSDSEKGCSDLHGHQ